MAAGIAEVMELLLRSTGRVEKRFWVCLNTKMGGRDRRLNA